MDSLQSPQSGKALVICEKPSVAGDLLAAFGGGSRKEGYYEFSEGFITWCYGHMLELVPPEVYNPDWKMWDMGALPLVPPNYGFRYGISAGKDNGKGTKTQLGVISKLIGQCDYLVNAADAGREGELIFWEAAKFAGWGKNEPAAVPGSQPCYRFWCNKMTAEGLRGAWNTMDPISKFLPLARAAYCRSESDWLLGMSLTRAASIAFPRQWGENAEEKVRVWSVGRVQTPVLAIIVRRDLAIENFVSKPFYELKLSYLDASGLSNAEPFSATLRVPDGFSIFDPNASDDPSEEGSSEGEASGRKNSFLNKADAEKVLSEIQARSENWTVEDTGTDVLENPPGLFDLTSLQRWCNQAWGWSAQKTLTVAQAAYETDKVLTYPRTTSAFLPEDSPADMDALQEKLLNEWVPTGVPDFPTRVLPKPSVSPRASFLFDDSKVSDHFAIVPTGVIPKDFDNDVAKLWRAVVRRFITAFAEPAKVRAVKRAVSLSGFPEGVRQAFCSGKTYTDRGWIEHDDVLAALTGGVRKSEGKTLAECGSLASCESGNLHEGSTSPPRAFDEASLLAIMQNISAKLSGEELEEGEVSLGELKDVLSELGLGTPATRAETIETLLTRGFIARAAKGPVPKSAGNSKPKAAGKGAPKFLCATPAGRYLIESLDKIKLSYLTEAMLTAQWEKRLGDMANAKSNESRVEFLDSLVESLTSSVSIFSANAPEQVPRVEPVTLDVICPKSGQPVKDYGKFYRFPGLDKTRLWKAIAEREISAEEYVPLVESGQTDLLDKFISKGKKEFSAHLVLKGDKLEFKFPERAQVAGTPLDVLCPKSGEPVQDCGKFYRFPAFPKAAFWKTVAQRPMTAQEYLVVLRDGKCEPLPGFISKAGKPFSAALKFVTEDGGKVDFDFPPRDGKPKGKGKAKK